MKQKEKKTKSNSKIFIANFYFSLSVLYHISRVLIFINDANNRQTISFRIVSR